MIVSLLNTFIKVIDPRGNEVMAVHRI